MRYEDCKVGMVVKMNAKSDARYGVTTKEKGCIGEIVDCVGDSAEIKVVSHVNKWEIGELYTVGCEYFELLEVGATNEEHTPLIQFETTKKVKRTVEDEYGQLLQFDNGVNYLVAMDTDGCDYIAVSLTDMASFGYENSVSELIEYIERETKTKFVESIPAKNLKLVEV